LSATPNGKNHMDATDSPFRRHFVRDAAHSLSAANGFPPRSHNSLLHNCPSTNATGGQVTLR
jgi:hypothetical protein